MASIDAAQDSTPQSLVNLLAFARQKIREGQPSAALQLVISALRAKGGDMAVFEALHNARMLFHENLESNSHMDELAVLFSQCGISPLNQQISLIHDSPFGSHSNFTEENITSSCMELELGNGSSSQGTSHSARNHNDLTLENIGMNRDDQYPYKGETNGHGISVLPILVESGRSQVLVDASSDGSSFTCPKCLGIVNLQRQEEHFSYWCSGVQ